MSVSKIWKSKETAVTEDQLKACGNNRVLACLLKNRGIETPEKIKEFLNPLKASFISPDVFIDMKKSVERIKSAIENGEHMTVFGDFDADGITSTALLYLTLKQIGANVDFYLPDRGTESHGLNTKALVKIISKSKSKLIITVDCGISNVAEVNFAKTFKTDIIITDHHEAPEILPDAFAIINPKAAPALDSSLDINSLKSLSYLAGVGVAFKLACKLLEIYKCEDFVHEILPLAAVGTIGDVVELIGENRSIVAMGLELIRNGKHSGIQKILEAMGVSDPKTITSETVAFGIVPRLNAAGRLDSPKIAINALIGAEDQDETVKLLNDLNTLRQELCDETFKQAKAMYEKNKSQNKKSIVLFCEDWHIGIIGIVSSKLVEAYNKPVFLMTRDANNPNIIRCSSRSINGINVYDVLSRHKEVFEGFGGHKMAAGFSFDETKIKFEEFKKQLNQTIDEIAQDIDFNKITIEADMIVEPEDIDFATIEAINKLEPFGSANAHPLFIINDLTLNQYKMMGQNANHLKMFLSKNNTDNIECVKWNTPDFNLKENSKLDILFSPKINEFNGNTSIQFMVEDIHAQGLEKQINILDHRNKKDILNQVLDFISSTKKTTSVFVQSPKLKKQIESCPKAVESAFDFDNIPPECEQLMIFECPPSQEDLVKIINSTNTKTVHLMNFNTHEIIMDNYISTLSGMLKYAISNLNGIFEANKLAKALAVTSDVISDSLNLFDEAGMIDLTHINDNQFKITKLNPIELSKIKQNENFTILEEKIAEINNFRRYYLSASTDEIKSQLQE